MHAYYLVNNHLHLVVEMPSRILWRAWSGSWVPTLEGRRHQEGPEPDWNAVERGWKEAELKRFA
jgi:hypothetical protein